MLITPLALAVVVVGATPPQPQRQCDSSEEYISDEDRFWGQLPHGTIIERCAESSAEYDAAMAALVRLGKHVEAVDDAADARPIVEEMLALLRTPCFRLAREDGRIPRFDSARSLKHWWQNGGESWLGSYLRVPRYGEMGNLKEHVIVPGDPRPTLALDRGAGAGLGMLLCALSDHACGAETRGWLQRAENEIRLRRRAGDLFHDPKESDSNNLAQTCQKDMTGGLLPTAGPYAEWRRCLTDYARHDKHPPLGSFRAPADGWFVLHGRRGHYEFCDGVWLYDVRTGAAFSIESCSGLALRDSGTVDRDATNSRREQRIRAGRIGLENLREAVMIIVLLEHAKATIDTAAYPLPKGMKARLIAGQQPLKRGRGGGFSSAQTELSWEWVTTNGSLKGDLVWPFSDDALEDHAANLLDIAEAGFVEGCVPNEPPTPELLRDRLPPVSRTDAHKANPEDTHQRLGRTLTLWADTPRCK